MNNNMKKAYDYEAILDYCKSGGKSDQHLTKLQEDLKALRTLIYNCQTSYHGIGTDSSVYKAYNKVFYHIGEVNDNGSGTPHGLWYNAYGVKTLFNMMYYNASKDKEQDNDDSILYGGYR